MQGASRAIAWELTRRHRLGLIVLGVYLVGFWAVKRLVLPEAVLRFDPPNGLAAFVVIPLAITFVFFVGAFSYGLSGDLGTRESCFPRRMFYLPVGTATLAGWPMLYGTVASVSVWIIGVLLVLVAGGMEGDVPLIWPALSIAAFLAWMQALTWLAYPLRGLRVVVAVLVLVASDLIVVLAIEFHATEATMIAILAPQIAVAYVVGYFAVRMARRGMVPDWNWIPAYAGMTPEKPFSSPARAQAWLEWRQHGRSLPVMVAFVVPCELALLFLPGNDRAGMVFFLLFVVFITLPAMAIMVAPALGSFSTHAATRPFTDAQLVAAKLEMTVRSTVAAWVLTAVFVLIALVWSGTMPVVVEKMRDLEEIAGTTRAFIIAALVLAAFVLSTWKNLVQSLCIGLSGRPWIIRSSVLLGLFLFVMAFPIAWVVLRKQPVQRFVWDYLPWMLAALVWLKVSAAAWVAIRLHDRGVLPARAIVGSALAWLAAVAIAYGSLAWLLASPMFPPYFLGAIAILAVPLARLSAAPLALAGSRHR